MATINKTKSKSSRRNILKDVAGVTLLTAGALTLALLLFETGFIGQYFSAGMKWGFGIGRYILPPFLMLMGGVYFAKNKDDSLEAFGLGFALFFVTVITAIHLSVTSNKSFEPEYLFSYGGLMGATISQLLSRMLGVVGAYILIAGAFAASIIFITGLRVRDIYNKVFSSPKKEVTKKEDKKKRKSKAEKELSARRELRDNVVSGRQERLEKSKINETVESGVTDTTVETEGQLTIEINDVISDGYNLPPLSLLKRTMDLQGKSSKKNDKTNAIILEQTLEDFGIAAKVDKVTKGPTVTCYELQIASGTKVTRIVSLSDDIALALAAADVRVLAPIPGKSAVGIEVPNDARELVTLGDILTSDEAKRDQSVIAFGIGKDISGKSVIGNLGEMPHLLIAGATGSGKSISVNALLMSLLARSHPDQVKMILIDPKRVELSMYNSLPHLLVPVVTQSKEAATALQWAVGEMERRYESLAESRVRNIVGFNEAIAKGKIKDKEELPYIVIIIDELADLMMVAAGEVEDAICRLAQMARAVGIHLIVATQRPSTDIITGLIKANITTRIAFQVSSQIDSRVILDTPGAEKLVGKGDMLYMEPGSNKPKRVQGAFVTENEIELLTGYIKKQQNPEYQLEILKEKKTDGGGFDDFEDELYEKAMELVITTGQASTSALQRRLRVGYSRAARLIDMLEQRGIVGPLEGSKPRAILITPEELDDISPAVP